MATNSALPRRHVRAFREFLAGEGQAFLERVDAWLSAHAAPADKHGDALAKRDRPIRSGVGVYLIHDDEPEQGERAHDPAKN